ncbi:MAG: ATP synthase F0 subunit B [Acidobacteriia bacterium]|nr:ATP synthase F0 subunit B [Terriglobia bacterium]
MRRFGWRALVLGLLLVLPAIAQESENGKKGEEANDMGWRIANFALLAGGLGYLIGKNGGPFFAGRSRKITGDLARGEEARKEAERRSAEVERRLANLESEIAALRTRSRAEADQNAERMRQDTAAEMAKIRARSEQEIAAAGKTARAELKRYSAELAIGIAEQKIRSRLNSDTQDALVGDFLGELDDPAAQNRKN